jgi:hypothetical protein
MSNEWPIISKYTWEQMVADGDAVEILKHRWPELSSGKPILATTHLFNEISLAGLMECWNDFVIWKATVEMTLPVAERMFTTEMNCKTLWIIEDSETFTMMFPEDY